jgi:hypothetical protein
MHILLKPCCDSAHTLQLLLVLQRCPAHLIMVCSCGEDVVISKGFEGNSILQAAAAATA